MSTRYVSVFSKKSLSAQDIDLNNYYNAIATHNKVATAPFPLLHVDYRLITTSDHQIYFKPGLRAVGIRAVGLRAVGLRV